MKINILTFFLLLNISISYYSLKLNKVNLKNLSNGNNNKNKSIGNNKIKDEYFEYLKNNADFPLNYSELKLINESFIPN